MPDSVFMVPAKTVSAQNREHLAKVEMWVSIGQSLVRFNEQRIISRFGLIPEYLPAKV